MISNKLYRIYINGLGPIITWFKAQFFELVLRDAALVRASVGEDFRPVYGIGANQHRKI